MTKAIFNNAKTHWLDMSIFLSIENESYAVEVATQ